DQDQLQGIRGRRSLAARVFRDRQRRDLGHHGEPPVPGAPQGRVLHERRRGPPRLRREPSGNIVRPPPVVRGRRLRRGTPGPGRRPRQQIGPARAEDRPAKRDRGRVSGAPLALVRNEREDRCECRGRLPPRRDRPPSDAESAGAINGLFLTLFGLMQFLFAPVLGALSDRYGRRPVLILSGFGLGVDYMIMALAPNLEWLFVGRILSGITSSSFAAAGAYVADVTPPERRAAAFGMVGAAWGIGFIIGPAFGGLVALLGPRYPFWAAAAFSVTSASYGLLLLPESLSVKNRERFRWRKANPLGSLVLLRSNPQLFSLGAVIFVQYLAFQVLPSIFTIYANYRIGWGITEVGLSLGLV